MILECSEDGEYFNENRGKETGGQGETDILHAAPGGAHPVDGVARNPDHRGEGHEESWRM